MFIPLVRQLFAKIKYQAAMVTTRLASPIAAIAAQLSYLYSNIWYIYFSVFRKLYFLIWDTFSKHRLVVVHWKESYEGPNIPKRNDSKSNYAKNGNPWFSYRYCINNSNYRLGSLYNKTLIELVVIIIIDCVIKKPFPILYYFLLLLLCCPS